MLDKAVAQLLNTQINKELYSAYLYLDFANYYEEQGLAGFAHWYDCLLYTSIMPKKPNANWAIQGATIPTSAHCQGSLKTHSSVTVS